MSKVNLLIFPGELDANFFHEILSIKKTVKLNCVLIEKKEQIKEWSKITKTKNIFLWSDLANKSFKSTKYHDLHYSYVIHKVLSDPRTTYIMERIYRSLDLSIIDSSVFNKTLNLEKIIWNIISVIFMTKPNRLIHYNIPHGKYWFVAKVAELIGIKFYGGADTVILPWKQWLVRGLDKQVLIKPKKINKIDYESIENYFNKIKGTYEKAIPNYEKERQVKFSNKFFSFKKEIGSIILKGIRSRSVIEVFFWTYLSFYKYKALKLYEKFSKNFKLPKKYIIFFMHYQPERTSLPEGLNYCNQWLIIRSISEKMPKDCELIVKEHPSTFRYFFDPSFRSKEFYESVSQLENTHLAPLNYSPFKLLDNAYAVATITGTVGAEAFIRNKNVLVFGIAQYRNLPNVNFIRSFDEVETKLKTLNNSVESLNDKKILEVLCKIDSLSYTIDKELNFTSKKIIEAAIYADSK